MRDSFQKRRLGFVSPFHRWFFFKFSIYAGGFVVLIAIGMLTWFKWVMSEFTKITPYVDTAMLREMQASFRSTLFIGIVIIFILLLIGLLMIAILGQKISGPLHAISRDLDRMHGQVERVPIRLREDDLFTELAYKINRVLGLKSASETSHPDAKE
jgi:hypothetical protein